MKARSRGTAVVLIVGLVVAVAVTVAVPAGAQSGPAPAPQIVTAVARTSHLTMKSGFSQYLYVGGTSADALIADTSFHHTPWERCEWKPPRGTVRQHHGQAPFGPSSPPSAEGSFTTSGDVAALAGIGLKGYSIESSQWSPGGTGICGETETRQPDVIGSEFTTGGAGGLVLILVGTEGVGTLAPNLIGAEPATSCPTVSGQQVTTLQNLTVSKGLNDGGAVGVFSVPLPANTTCQLIVYGTSYNEPNVAYSMWSDAYVLVPTTT